MTNEIVNLSPPPPGGPLQASNSTGTYFCSFCLFVSNPDCLVSYRSWFSQPRFGLEEKLFEVTSLGTVWNNIWLYYCACNLYCIKKYANKITIYIILSQNETF